MKRAEPFLVMAILAVALLLRVLSLDADPPSWLSWSAGLYSDEGIYSEDARLWVLYGQHMQGDFHSSVIAPLQHYILIWVFHRWTISLVNVRRISVVFGMGVLAAFWAALRVWYDRRTALIGLAFLAVSAPFVFYNRMALLETPALFWLVLGYFGLAVAERSRFVPLRFLGLLAAGVFMGGAVAWKATFVLGALPLIGYALWRHRIESITAVVGLGAVLAVYAHHFYLPHQDEIARANSYYLTHQYLPHSLAAFWFNLHRGLLTGEDDGILPYLVKYSGLLWAAALYAAFRGNRRGDALLWAWLLVPTLAFLFSCYTPSRYFLIFWPALAAIAARGVVALGLQARKTTWTIAATAVLVAINFGVLGMSWRSRTYTMHDDARTLARVLPKDAWVAGQFAPSLCLDNSLRSMYVQKGLANDHRYTLKLLPITHVLATHTQSASDDPWAGKYGSLIQGPSGLKTLPVGSRFEVNVYANKEALP